MNAVALRPRAARGSRFLLLSRAAADAWPRRSPPRSAPARRQTSRSACHICGPRSTQGPRGSSLRSVHRRPRARWRPIPRTPTRLCCRRPCPPPCPSAHIAVLNRGIGGQDAAEELARLDVDVLALRPQLVIWQVGANGALRNVDPSVFHASGRRRRAADAGRRSRRHPDGQPIIAAPACGTRGAGDRPDPGAGRG